MAEDEDEREGEASETEGEGEGEGQRPKQQGKSKLIIFIAAALLLVVGGTGAAYFTGLLDPLVEMMSGPEEMADGTRAPTGPQDAVFYDLPELLVNMNTSGGRKATFLKIRVSLELASAQDVLKVEAVMPRIIDNFQTYLRELRVEDLKGSAGMYRLREELLTRVAAATAPARINDVLFKEMLVQ
jgi:flagellar FliL protein